MRKWSLSDIQKHDQGIEWMAKVRLPRSRTEVLGHCNVLLLPRSWHLQPPSLISTQPTLSSAIRNVFSTFLPAPSDWLWHCSPNTYGMGPISIFSLPCSVCQRWLQGIMGLWKSRGQEEVCVQTCLPDIHPNVQLPHCSPLTCSSRGRT